MQRVFDQTYGQEYSGTAGRVSENGNSANRAMELKLAAPTVLPR